MVRKFLSRLLGMRDYVEEELQKECFPKPKYIRCFSGEENREIARKKAKAEVRTTPVSLGVLKVKKNNGNV